MNDSRDEQLDEVKLPGAFTLAWRFGWPLLLVIGCATLMIAMPEFLFHLLIACGVTIVLGVVNVVVQATALYRPHRDEPRRERILRDRIGVAIVAAIVLLILSPFLMFGACMLALDELL